MRGAKKGLDINLANLVRLGVLFLVVTIALLGWHYYGSTKNPIPKNIRTSVSFPTYYPSKSPAGYVLDKNSVKADNGIIFYNFTQAENTIFVSEQAAPANPPDLKTLQGFTTLDSSLGSIAAGTTNGSSVAILLTTDAIVTIHGSNGISKSTVTDFAKDMKSLRQ